jgi:mRNA interferase MazF
MTTPERGDVILVPFPFTDLSDTKRRPALVLSSREYNDATGDVIIAQITSRVTAPHRLGDHPIAGWRDAGLLAPSLLRAKLTTLHIGLVVRTLGRMSREDSAAIDKALAGVLCL